MESKHVRISKLKSAGLPSDRRLPRAVTMPVDGLSVCLAIDLWQIFTANQSDKGHDHKSQAKGWNYRRSQGQSSVRNIGD